eukprot:GHRR01019348.1.p1 GENE.GHRR01019348.1~~GHRR01019348.1.p1  ORF type:complete len:302 (+),score=65.39 GHRR01019348.1:201-1106(+)
MLYVMGLMPLLEQIRTTARCTLYHLAASWRITSNVQQLGAHLLPGNCPNQQFATAANTQQGLPLKAALRQLYKRVHPDLFTGYPVEQAENERSFKLLQDYLHQARTTRPSLGPTSRTAYHFKFYLTPEDTETSESLAAPSNSASASLHLVQQTLAPPEPSRPTPGHLSPAVVKALGKLLTACGLTPVQVDQQEEEDALASMNKLTHFLPAAAEVGCVHSWRYMLPLLALPLGVLFSIGGWAESLLNLWLSDAACPAQTCCALPHPARHICIVLGTYTAARCSSGQHADLTTHLHSAGPAAW